LSLKPCDVHEKDQQWQQQLRLELPPMLPVPMRASLLLLILLNCGVKRKTEKKPAQVAGHHKATA